MNTFQILLCQRFPEVRIRRLLFILEDDPWVCISSFVAISKMKPIILNGSH